MIYDLSFLFSLKSVSTRNFSVVNLISVFFFPKPDLLVFDNYSEPADLRLEPPPSAPREEEEDPLYMSPLDDRGTAPPLEDEDMYCLPYDTEEAPPLPQPCLLHQQQGELFAKSFKKSISITVYFQDWNFPLTFTAHFALNTFQTSTTTRH